MSCGIQGCKFNQYTPGGSRNFACKFWSRKAEEKQIEISQRLQDNDDLADFYDDYENEDIIDQVVKERDSYFPEIRSLLFKHEAVTDSNVDEMLSQITSIETEEAVKRAFSTIKEIHEKPFDQEEVPLSDKAKKTSQILRELDSIPILYDSRSQQVLKRHAEALTVLFKSVFPELREKQDQQMETTSHQQEEQHQQQDEFFPLSQHGHQDHHFLDLFYNSFSLIENVIKLLDNLLVTVKPETRNDKFEASGLYESLPNEFKDFRNSKTLNRFFRRSKFLSIFPLNEEAEKEKNFFVCSNKDEVIRLYQLYPNFFYLSPNFKFGNKCKYEDIMSDYAHNDHRIIMVPRHQVIPDEVYHSKETTVFQLVENVRKFFLVKNNHLILPRYLFYELELFKLFQTESCKLKYILKYGKYNELIDNSNYYEVILDSNEFK